MHTHDTPLTRHRLRFAHALDLGAQDPHSVHVVRADGRGIQVHVPAGWTSVWISLAGAPEMETAWSTWQLEPGQAMVWSDGMIRASGRASCWWLVVAAPSALWCSRGISGGSRSDVQLLPWQGYCARELKRIAIHIARTRRHGEVDPNASMEMLAALLLEQQEANIRRWLPRCSGRTLQRKQQSLLRLLRVERIVRSNPEARMDLASLARVANYSPHHLIRVYRNVFGETPAEYAIRLRTQRAWRLVRETHMPICEITELLGFESQSAFCRAFKHSFGITTSQARRLHVVQSGRWQDQLPVPAYAESRAA